MASVLVGPEFAKPLGVLARPECAKAKVLNRKR
jgi:hypothetical protein